MIDFLVLDLMLPLLIICFDFTHNYGLAIVVLTFIIKSALMPFAFQGIKAQLEMQRVQPKLKEIQQKYKDKPEIMNKKMMEFYKENKVNPLGGCMPILIQMPFFIALYSVFLSEAFTAEAGNNSSFLFMQDMTRIGISHNGALYYDNLLLILLFGVSTFISQKMMITNPDDPMQKQMLYMMPIMITFMFTFIPVPSGCLLYLVISNIFTIGQNVIVLKKKKALSASMDLSGSKSASIVEGNNKSINLDKNDNDISSLKNDILSEKQEELSPVLVTAGKSKRAKKKQKKNRKK